MASPISDGGKKGDLGIKISHASIAWNHVVPNVTHDRLGKLGYVDCLVLRLGMYCLFRAVFAEIVVQTAMLHFYDTVNTFCIKHI
jgi:hypothetical protein